MKIKLDTKDKVALISAWCIVYVIGLFPSIVIGWTWYLFRDKLKDLYNKYFPTIRIVKDETFTDKLKNLFR